ncbi:MAG TPA: YraN family protein [Peptococcaceae bacterium]|nr:YraN family protein [Peptococcaceae bacterium]
MDFTLNKRPVHSLKKKELGQMGESLAVAYLQEAGLRIIQQNYRCPKGELDIVARDGEYLVFVEVRTRTSAKRGTAEESISGKKAQKLKTLAAYYLLERGFKEWPPLRFDVVAINVISRQPVINWIKNIF